MPCSPLLTVTLAVLGTVLNVVTYSVTFKPFFSGR